jgi:5-bromo-4-chloroindolyl phosphate hydrolysis protein
MIVFSGIFGMAQIIFTYFLIKSFLVLDMAIAVTLMIDVVAVVYRAISNIGLRDIKVGPLQ